MLEVLAGEGQGGLARKQLDHDTPFAVMALVFKDAGFVPATESRYFNEITGVSGRKILPVSGLGQFGRATFAAGQGR